MTEDPARKLAEADRAYRTAIQCGEADAAAVAWSDVTHWRYVIAGAEPDVVTP
jgi:hypothetical protein